MKRLSLVFALLITTHAFADVEISSALDQYCPASVDLQADIGPLSPAGTSDDGEYKELSNTRIEGVYSRTRSADTCLLTEVGTDQSINSASHKKYLEIKKATDGSIKVTLEGYTKSGKIYSIRSHVIALNALSGRYDASVFEGTGGRERLGEAVLLANELDPDQQQK